MNGFRNRIIILSFLWFFPLIILSQNVEFDSKSIADKTALNDALKNIRIGDGFFAKKNGLFYVRAIENYEKANAVNPYNALLNFKIGVCYLNSNNKAKSLEYFEKAKELNSNIDIKINYALAQAYHYNLQFDKAIETYNLYLSEITQDLEKKNMQAIIEKKIKECENGKLLFENPVDVTVENLGSIINTKYNSFTPLTTKIDSFLILTSRRKGNKGNQIDYDTQEYFEDIYFTEKRSGVWQEPTQLSSSISTTTHDAAVGLSFDGNTLFIYKGLNNNGDIYETNQVMASTWSIPKSISAINTEFHESSACLTEDGRTIYFVSNRPDKSLGDHDIFVSHKNAEGTWDSPENMGSKINSPFDEEGVFISKDGKTLYFSSKGHNSMGGYDVFRSSFENGEWSEAVNMGYPFNTPDDDLYCQAFGEVGLEEGYFSSVRSDGLGEKDLYYFKFNKPEPIVIQETKLDSTNFNVSVHNGEPSEAFANIGGDNQTKIQSHNELAENNNNTSTQSNKTTETTETSETNTQKQPLEPNTYETKSIIKTTGNSKNSESDNSYKSIYIPIDNGVVFHVQVAATRKPMPKKELKERYGGSMSVSEVEHEGWYKYLIGNFTNYGEAKSAKQSCGTFDAWVVVYKDGKRVNINDVKEILSYFSNSFWLLAQLNK